MRIIAGEFRGRRLHANSGQTTRPITDRAKTILFDRIQPILSEARVADVFSGTGSLGLEALSRGAHSVIFYDADKLAHSLLKKNVETLGLDEQTFCWKTDILRTSFRPMGYDHFLPYDIIFFDPPYPLAEKQLRPGRPLYQSLHRISQAKISDERCSLFLRLAKHAEVELPPDWQSSQSPITVGSMKILCLEKQTIDLK